MAVLCLDRLTSECLFPPVKWLFAILSCNQIEILSRKWSVMLMCMKFLKKPLGSCPVLAFMLLARTLTLMQ
jgi:hypothetical protein